MEKKHWIILSVTVAVIAIVVVGYKFLKKDDEAA